MIRNPKIVTRVRDLLRQVPRPPEELPPTGASEADFEIFQERTGIAIPEDLQEWLSISNGPCVGPGGMYGIEPARESLNIESFYEHYPAWKDTGWIPIAGDGCGNYYVLATHGEYGPGFPVLFVETMEDSDRPAYIVASDIWHFLVFIFESELSSGNWPFDQREVIARDPEIVQYQGVPLPWEGQ